MSVWSLSDAEQRKERFWRTKPPDPTRAFAKSGTPYYRPGRSRVLMPDDFMPLGEHAGKHLRAVPQDYLLWVNSQPWSKAWPHWQPIADYISRFLLDASDSDNPTRPPAPARPRSNDTAAPSSIDHPFTPIFYLDRLRKHPTPIKCFQPGSGHLHCLPGHEDLLHAFALGALRLDRQWYQNGTLPHYDLTVRKHAQALQHSPTVHLIPDKQLLQHQQQWLQYFQSKPHLRSELKSKIP